MSAGQWVGVVVGVAALFTQSAGSGRAGAMFGPSEDVRKIQPTGDPQYNLCHKVRYYFFILGCYVADDGYVLQATGDKDRYIPLDPATVARLQKEGILPNPLPRYSLRFWDYLVGYSNWIMLAVVSVVALVRRAVRGEEPDGPPPREETRAAVRPKPFDATGVDPQETYRKKCPACGSDKIRVLIPDSQDDSLKFSNFRVFHDRQCKECGRNWTPACPRRLAYWLVALGTVLLGGAAVIVLLCIRDDGAEKGLVTGATLGVLPFVGGFFPFVYGVGTLRGWLGRLKMR